MTTEDKIFQALSQFASIAKTRISARSIGSYMAGGNWGMAPFPPRDSVTGPLRILSRRLSSSLTGAAKAGQSVREGIVEFTRREGQGVRVVFGSAVPYARVHELGFTGTVAVPAHQRTISQAFGRPISARTVNVSAHSKHMNIPARPYLGPALDREEDFLVEWLEDQVAKIIEDDYGR